MKTFPYPPRASLFAASILALTASLPTQNARAADPILVKTPDFPRPAHPPLGVNLEPVLDFAHSQMFVDLIKSARKFGSPDAPWDEKAKTDDHGWPTEDAGVVLAADTPVPPGDYLFSCTGRCDLSVVASPGSISNPGYDRDKNLTTATVTVPDGANKLFLAFKHTTNGIQNIRLLRPGYPLNTTETFNKDFLKALEPFSTLRLMDVMRTNESKVKEWADRAKPTDALQSSKAGVAWELMIQLANQTHKDLWINIPVQASDDYVKQLAQLLKAKLDKDRCIYVEYSNEVWNTIFPQYHWNYDAAKADVKAGDTTLNDGGKDDNTYYWAYKRVARRLVEISNIFRDVYADKSAPNPIPNAINTVIRPVLASQSANPGLCRMQVEFIEKNAGPPSRFIYGIAGAPYIGPNAKVLDKDGATSDDLLQSAADSGMKWISDVTLQYQTLARYYRLHSLSYEGGPGFAGNHNVDAQIAANRDPKITTLIQDYLNQWYSTGGELFMYFDLAGGYSRFGSWGLTEDIRKSTPKTKAVADIANEKLPDIVAGTTLPATLNAWEPTAKNGGANGTGNAENSPDGGKDLAFVKNDFWFDYLLYVKTPGNYAITLKSAGAKDAAVELLLSTQSLGAVPLKTTGDYQSWTDSDPLLVHLEKGQIVLRLRITKAGANIRSINIEKK